MASRTTNVPASYDPSVFQAIFGDYDKALAALSRAVGRYAVSNFTRTTTLNMGTATATDIGNFLCTVVEDLQKANRLGS